MKTLFLSAFIALSLTSYGQSGYGSIMGNIIDVTRQPVDSCIIVVLKKDQPLDSIMTDPEGKFWLNSIRPGNYYIQINKSPYVGLLITEVIVSADKITFIDDRVLRKYGEENIRVKRKRRK